MEAFVVSPLYNFFQIVYFSVAIIGLLSNIRGTERIFNSFEGDFSSLNENKDYTRKSKLEQLTSTLLEKGGLFFHFFCFNEN